MTLAAGWAFAVGFGIGTVRNPLSFEENIGWGILSAAATRPVVVNSILRPVGTTVLRTAAADAAILARAAATTSTASIAAAAAVGYTLGATGTIVASGALERKGLVQEGTTESLTDFYTFGLSGNQTGVQSRDRSAWYESEKPILNIPGDIAYIGTHYWNKWV